MKLAKMITIVGMVLTMINAIDLSAYPSETYFVKIQNEGEVITRKLIKN